MTKHFPYKKIKTVFLILINNFKHSESNLEENLRQILEMILTTKQPQDKKSLIINLLRHMETIPLISNLNCKKQKNKRFQLNMYDLTKKLQRDQQIGLLLLIKIT